MSCICVFFNRYKNLYLEALCKKSKKCLTLYTESYTFYTTRTFYTKPILTKYLYISMVNNGLGELK